MSAYSFHDVLTGSNVETEYLVSGGMVIDNQGEPGQAKSLFFPGCSNLAYASPLVQSVYQLLLDAGVVDGMSLLCCGKILVFEEDGKTLLQKYAHDLCDILVNAGVEKMVCACPNCVETLHKIFSEDARMANVELVALPMVLAELGYSVDSDVALTMLTEDVDYYRTMQEAMAEQIAAELHATPEPSMLKDKDLAFMVHDSCPDRAFGIFAEGVRALMPEELIHESAYGRKKSVCCGSRIAATGRFELGAKQSLVRAEQALAVKASGIVTACMSCTFQLTLNQNMVPVFHYLELLYNWRVPWAQTTTALKYRFVPQASLAYIDATKGRQFKGLGAPVDTDGQSQEADVAESAEG